MILWNGPMLTDIEANDINNNYNYNYIILIVKLETDCNPTLDIEYNLLKLSAIMDH